MKSFFDSKNKGIKLLIFLFLLSVSIRIPIILIYGDTSLEHEWKFLVQNLILHGQLAYESFGEFLLPNLWMPPLYAYYLYVFSFIGLENQNYILLILSTQVLLASISVVVFYKINELFFSKRLSFYSSILFSLFPLHAYTCSQISSITLQVFLYICFFYFFFQICKTKKNSSIVIFSILAGLILLLRGEFQVIFLLSVIYLFLFYKISIKKTLLIFSITLITISPYLTRNFLIFEKITLVETFGYNLWKGNHPYAMKNSLVEGSEIYDGYLPEQSIQVVDGFRILNTITKDKFYRFNFNKFFLNQAIKNIKKEPGRYLILYLKKIASFLLIDIKSSEPNYYNPLHYLPVLFLGITSLIGISLSDKKSYELNYLILILFAIVLIFSTVSILPRYKLTILPLQIIFTNVLIKYMKEKFFYRAE